METQTFTEPWKKIADSWANWSGGAHPSADNIKHYQRFLDEAIQGIKEPKALIMGATPELRDMLSRYPQIEVTILDINWEMIMAMTSLLKEEPKNEVWIKANWLTAPLQANYYDVAFGDLIKGNIPYSEQSLLYKSVHHALKPSGTWIERLASRFPDFEPYDPEEIIQKYSAILPTNESVSDLIAYLLFMSHTEEITSVDRYFDLLKTHSHLPHISEYLELSTQLLPAGKIWDYGKAWEEDKDSILTYFDIKDKAEDDSPYHGYSYIFKCTPKIVN